MSATIATDNALASAIFHPTDLSALSEAAFNHALAISVAQQSALTILHAGSDDQDPWEHFPAVRQTLEQWGILPPGSPQSAVHDQLNLSVRKVVSRDPNPINACLDYLETHAADLLVLATEGRQGLARWMQPSVAERLAREVRTHSLFVAADQRGFVDDSGKLQLRRILLPVDHQPDPGPALWAVTALAALSPEPVEVMLLHGGEADLPSRLSLPATDHCHWQTLSRPADDVVSLILDQAREAMTDLIVMATAGHHGILDALRGSVTEQVLRNAPCPLLAVPADHN